MKSILIKICLIAVLVIGLVRCSYLEEESYGATVGVFDTEEGSDALVHLLYSKINNLYGGGFTFGILSESGTDIWLRGNNNGAIELTDYKGLDGYEGNLAWLWNHCYKAVWNSNLFLETIDNVPYENEATKKYRKAEVLTLQAMFLWIITETWGGAYLPQTTAVEEGLAAKRSDRLAFYERIIGNLETALTLVSVDKAVERGRVDYWVIKSFLARMYLYAEDWQKAIDASSDVILNGGYVLSPNWKDLWDASKTNSEFIWTSEFSSDEAFGGGSGVWWQASQMFIDRFAGVQTELGWTGYGGCRMLPSRFYLDLFDKEADLRWEQGHQWVWYYNDPNDNTSEFPMMKTMYRDTALFLYNGVFTPEQREYTKKRYTAFDISDQYDERGVPKDRFTFVGVSKFDDHTRPSSMSTLSSRNYPVIRLAELYLIRAEANMRKAAPDRQAAADDINFLRRRIVKPGFEDRMKVQAANIDLDFLLDERGRELTGEFQRWFDLRRTGKLLERVKMANPDASAFIKDFHQYRPIPQEQFDGMPDPSTLGQNPGY